LHGECGKGKGEAYVTSAAKEQGERDSEQPSLSKRLLPLFNAIY
jgi:hypothetical protein